MRLRCIAIAVLGLLIANAASAAPRRAVSLRVLQSTLRAGESQQAMQLCGITRLSGFLVDKKNHDIILFGDVDPTLPPLRFDDLVIAMRNANFAYVRKVGRVRYYTPPGCSIDPNPAVIRQMQTVSDKLSGTRTPEERKQFLDQWREIGQQPQNVRVMGVPFDSRFAKVMVDADFYMKRLANGTVRLDIDGFRSMTEMSLEGAQKALDSGQSVETGQTLNRFWFCPGDTTFSDDDGVVLLRSCPVKLLTEQEYLTTTGMKGYGRPDPMARRFAEDFTAKYGQICEARPIYKELAGLFRLFAIAKLFKEENAAAEAGFNQNYLLDQYPAKDVGVFRAVKGITDVQEISSEKDTEGGGKYTAYLWHMSFGGVSMDIRPRRVSDGGTKPRRPQTHSQTRVAQPHVEPPARQPASAPKHSPTPERPTPRVTSTPSTTHKHPSSPTRPAAGLKKAVLESRQSSNSLYWDVPAGE